MINNVTIIGRLVADPELKYTGSGTSICDFAIAVNDKYKEQENTYFFQCTAFGKLGEVIAQYFSKGKQIPISGKLVQQKWESNGETKSIVKINVSDIDFIGKKDN